MRRSPDNLGAEQPSRLPESKGRRNRDVRHGRVCGGSDPAWRDALSASPIRRICGVGCRPQLIPAFGPVGRWCLSVSSMGSALARCRRMGAAAGACSPHKPHAGVSPNDGNSRNTFGHEEIPIASILPAAWFALLHVTGGMLTSCETPIGRAPDLQGTYWQNALVTNPNGGGPQVVRWGPPQNDNPSMPTDCRAPATVMRVCAEAICADGPPRFAPSITQTLVACRSPLPPKHALVASFRQRSPGAR